MNEANPFHLSKIWCDSLEIADMIQAVAKTYGYAWIRDDHPGYDVLVFDYGCNFSIKGTYGDLYSRSDYLDLPMRELTITDIPDIEGRLTLARIKEELNG